MRKNWKRLLIPLLAGVLTLAAAGTALAEETVKVKVENTKGGYILASYRDEEDNQIYLPIGKEVSIPKGTSLNISAHPLTPSGRYSQEINGKKGWVTVKAKDILANTESIVIGDAGDGLIYPANENVTLTGVYEGTWKPSKTTTGNDVYYELVFKGTKDYDYAIEAPGKWSGLELAFLDSNNKIVNFSHFGDAELEVYQADFYGEDEEWVDVTDEFRIEKGVLKGPESLKRGTYQIEYVAVNHEDEIDSLTGLTICVGMQAAPSVVLGDYEVPGDSTKHAIVRSGEYLMIEDGSTMKMKDLFAAYENNTGGKIRLAGYTQNGWGPYNRDSKTFGTYNENDAVSKYFDLPYANDFSLFQKYSDYKPETIKPLDVSELTIPVKQGWNEREGKWYYYDTEYSDSLVRNAWVPSDPDDPDSEKVWVGEDGAMAVNAVVNDGTGKYIVGKDGKKIKDMPTTIGRVTYTTDSDGKIKEDEIEIALETPSNATKAEEMVDSILDLEENFPEIATDDVLNKAADMLTDALKKNVKADTLEDEVVEKFIKLYEKAFNGGKKIQVIPDGVEIPDENRAILAAGLTSADAGGGITITFSAQAEESEESASNAYKFTVKMNVNGEERKPVSPVKLTVELPAEFLAAYDVTKYNFTIDGKKVTVDEDGKFTYTFDKMGNFTVKATKKSTSSGGSGGGGSATPSSGSGRTSTAPAKTGEWRLNDIGWWYCYSDGTWPANCWAYLPWGDEDHWYFFDANGYMVTGWHNWNNNLFYLYPVADGNRGYMFTGWNQISGKWFYFETEKGSNEGALYVNRTTPDGYNVGEDGAWIQ